jgi:hypothetical protein
MLRHIDRRLLVETQFGEVSGVVLRRGVEFELVRVLILASPYGVPVAEESASTYFRTGAQASDGSRFLALSPSTWDECLPYIHECEVGVLLHTRLRQASHWILLKELKPISKRVRWISQTEYATYRIDEVVGRRVNRVVGRCSSLEPRITEHLVPRIQQDPVVQHDLSSCQRIGAFAVADRHAKNVTYRRLLLFFPEGRLGQSADTLERHSFPILGLHTVNSHAQSSSPGRCNRVPTLSRQHRNSPSYANVSPVYGVRVICTLNDLGSLS